MRVTIEPIKYLVLADELRYSVSYVCPTCGYHVGQTMNLTFIETKELCSRLSNPCPNCPEGKCNFVSSYVSVKYVNTFVLSFNGLCAKAMDDNPYLEEAWENPCSSNICTCKQSNYISKGPKWPFICTYCAKLYNHSFIVKVMTTFNHIHLIQLDCLFKRECLQFNYILSEWIKPDVLKHT